MTQETAPTVAPDRSKAERVYRELRRRIRELALPPGAPIRKEEIALEMGVSRAPVSEAIARLADEALVDVFPQHGSFVAPIRAAAPAPAGVRPTGGHLRRAPAAGRRHRLGRPGVRRRRHARAPGPGLPLGGARARGDR